jgi:acyl carrier protein
MPASQKNPPSAAPAARTAGFVLGANWPRPEPAAPLSAGSDVLHPACGLENASVILHGIVTHFVEPELRPKLREPGENLRLNEDLGLDSLAMIEVMLRVEELLKVRVSDHDLRHFRTLGDVRQFIDRATRHLPVSVPAA